LPKYCRGLKTDNKVPVTDTVQQFNANICISPMNHCKLECQKETSITNSTSNLLQLAGVL